MNVTDIWDLQSVTKLEDFLNRCPIEGNESGMHQNILQRVLQMKQIIFQKLQAEQQAQQAAAVAQQQQTDKIPGEEKTDETSH